MLRGKHILIGVSGGIAAYKTPNLISALVKEGAEVKVVMTRAATEFVTELTFATMSKNPVVTDMFERPKQWDVEHISLAKWADVLFIVPATANIIGKLANGIADDMLSTVAMACRVPLLIAPAMNTAMYENAAVQENMKKLAARGAHFVEPEEGRLACGDVGKGKLAPVEELLDAVAAEIGFTKDFTGKKIMVTAGPTQERIDPVRFITNHSSGRMGYEIARAARYRGAEVTLVSGKTNLTPPRGVTVVQVGSAQDMLLACRKFSGEADIMIKTAAVADYRPKQTAEHKIKKGGAVTLELEQTTDILRELGGEKRPEQTLVGFCMETENLVENAKKKLEKKHLDMIVANSLLDENAGFGSANNTVTIIDRLGRMENLPNMSKFDVANEILDRILSLKKG